MDIAVAGLTVAMLLKYFIGSLIFLGCGFGLIKSLPAVQIIVKRKDESVFDKIIAVVPALAFLIGMAGGGYLVFQEQTQKEVSKTAAHYTLPGGGSDGEDDSFDGD